MQQFNFFTVATTTTTTTTKTKGGLKKKKKKNTATFFFLEKPDPKAWEIYSTKTKLMNISKHKGSNVIR